MHQAGEVGDVLFVFAQCHCLSDVSRPAGHSGRMPGGVVVLDVEGRNLALHRLQEEAFVTESQTSIVHSQFTLISVRTERIDEPQDRQ
jgi:hypothetical protein